MNPLVSVILVNWNHGDFLPECLAALSAQTYSPFELLVIDNGSTDGSPDWLARHAPYVRLIPFPDNRGFAPALNYGIQHTAGKFILSLNPDVVARPEFLAALVAALQANPRVGSAAPKLLRADDPARLDSTGLFIDRRRCPYDRGQGQTDRGQYDAQTNIFGACGAAALYRRAMLQDVQWGQEYFDEDFFAYYEDADLAWRAQWRGWQCRYAPGAVATHLRGGGDTLRKGRRPNPRGPRLAWRNRYLMTIKNDTLVGFLRDLPFIVGAELPRLAYATLTRPSTLLGLLDLLRQWPVAWRKRKLMQRRQVVEAAALRRWFLL